MNEIQYMKKQDGFTLIELIVVGGILAIISMLITGILYSTLRSTGKSTITSDISQNGNFAISIMSNIVTSSDQVLDVGNRFDFQDCTGGISGDSITLHRLDGGATTLTCENNTIASQSATGSQELIDTHSVKVATCSFTCTQTNSYSVPVIGISFILLENNNSPFVENKASATFETSVVLRNFQSL